MSVDRQPANPRRSYLRYLLPFTIALMLSGFISELFVINGTLDNNFLVESVSLVLTGIFAPLTVAGVVVLKKGLDSAKRIPRFTLLFAFSTLLIEVFWIALDISVPLNTTPEFDDLTFGSYFTLATFAFIFVGWLVSRHFRRGLDWAT